MLHPESDRSTAKESEVRCKLLFCLLAFLSIWTNFLVYGSEATVFFKLQRAIFLVEIVLGEGETNRIRVVLKFNICVNRRS